MNASRLQVTKDGSHTLMSNYENESYHSSYGAIQESTHIFIEAGLSAYYNQNRGEVKILEIGIGTGLNILLTYLWAQEHNVAIEYFGFEPYPISNSEVISLNYPQQLNVDREIFYSIHDSDFDRKRLLENFRLTINKTKIEDFQLPVDYFNVILFDAFSPSSQPELWTSSVFESLYISLKRGGVLTTYSCKGTVKRALKESGFRIEKLPGPPGKREFLRAWKD